jgi:hypothetical protein
LFLITANAEVIAITLRVIARSGNRAKRKKRRSVDDRPTFALLLKAIGCMFIVSNPRVAIPIAVPIQSQRKQ